MTLQPNVLGEPATNWPPCSFQGHLDAIRELHEDLADRVLRLPRYLVTASPQELGDYVATVHAPIGGFIEGTFGGWHEGSSPPPRRHERLVWAAGALAGR